MVSPAGHGVSHGSCGSPTSDMGHVQFAPAGWDMAAPCRSYKCEQEGPKEVERLLTAWQGAHCFLQKTTMSLPAGFVSQQRALLQSCVGERRNKCPQGCCEEHTSEQLLSLLSNLNFNRDFFSYVARGTQIPLHVLLLRQAATTCPHTLLALHPTLGPLPRQEESRHYTHAVHAALRDIPFNATPSSVKCLQIANSLGDSKY